MTGPCEELELEAGHWPVQGQTEAVVAAILADLQRVDGALSTKP